MKVNDTKFYFFLIDKTRHLNFFHQKNRKVGKNQEIDNKRERWRINQEHELPLQFSWVPHSQPYLSLWYHREKKRKRNK